MKLETVPINREKFETERNYAVNSNIFRVTSSPQFLSSSGTGLIGDRG